MIAIYRCFTVSMLCYVHNHVNYLISWSRFHDRDISMLYCIYAMLCLHWCKLFDFMIAIFTIAIYRCFTVSMQSCVITHLNYLISWSRYIDAFLYLCYVMFTLMSAFWSLSTMFTQSVRHVSCRANAYRVREINVWSLITLC